MNHNHLINKIKLGLLIIVSFSISIEASYSQKYEELCAQLHEISGTNKIEIAHEFVEENIQFLNFNESLSLKIELANYLQKAQQLKASIKVLESIKEQDLLPNQKCQFYYTQSRNYINTAQIEKGKVLLDSADTYKINQDDNSYNAFIPQLYGSYYFYIGDLINATQSYTLASNEYEKLGLNVKALLCRANLAAINIETRNFLPAIANLKKAKAHIVLPDHEAYLGIILNNLAIAYQHIDLDSSLHYNFLSKEYNVNKWNYYNTLGNVLIRKKEYENAEAALLTANDIADSLALEDEANYSGSSLCKLYSKKGETQKALLCFKKFDNYFKNTESAIAKRDFLHDLAQAKYASYVNDEDLNTYFNLADSIENDKVRGAVQNALLEAEIKKEQDSIQILSLQNTVTNEKLRFQNQLNRFYLFGLVLSLVIIYFLYRFFNAEKQNNKILLEKHNELIDQNQSLIQSNGKELGQGKSLDSSKTLMLTNREKTKIPLSDVLYLESKDKSVYIYTINGGQYRDWQSLKSFKEILPPDTFIQIHRSFIVNKNAIISGDFKMLQLTHDVSLAVSRSYKGEVQSVLKSLNL